MGLASRLPHDNFGLFVFEQSAFYLVLTALIHVPSTFEPVTYSPTYGRYKVYNGSYPDHRVYGNSKRQTDKCHHNMEATPIIPTHSFDQEIVQQHRTTEYHHKGQHHWQEDNKTYYHQNSQEVDLAFCETRDIPVLHPSAPQRVQRTKMDIGVSCPAQPAPLVSAHSAGHMVTTCYFLHQCFAFFAFLDVARLCYGCVTFYRSLQMFLMTSSQDCLGCATPLHWVQTWVSHLGHFAVLFFLFTLITTEHLGFGHHLKLGFF